MSHNRASRREIITLDEVPRSRTPEPAPKRPRTSRSYSRQASGLQELDRDLEREQGASSDQDPQDTIADPGRGQMLRLDQDPQATNASPEQGRMLRLDLDPQAMNASAEQDRMLRLDQDPQATNAITELADSASRDTSAMEPQVEEPEEGPGEVAVGESRENDPPTGAADSVETPLLTPWTLPVDATSSGVDSEVSPLAMMEQKAWDASVLPISRSETDADELPIARFAVTTEQSRLSSSTKVGTDLHASTHALEDDGEAAKRAQSCA